MDPWVKNILIDWRFEKYQALFEEEEVDKESFKCLTEDVIKSIIKKGGPQSRFLSKWKSEFGSAGSSDNFALKSVIKDDSSPHSNFDSNNVSVFFPEVDAEFDYSQSQAVSIKVENDFFSKIDNADLTAHMTSPVINLIDILQKSVIGISILSLYKQTRDLTMAHRSNLAEIIIDEEIRSNTKFVIKPERLQELAELIKDYFPTEETFTYYIPYSYDQITKKKLLPKGKLYDKYNSYRGILIECGIVQKLRGKKRKTMDESRLMCLGFRENLMSLNDDSEEYLKKLTWLKNNVEPWDQVKKYWTDTSKRRIENLINDSSSDDYINTFGALRHFTNGIELIDIDFSLLYPDKTSRIYSEFRSLENEIIEYCKHKARKSAEIKYFLTNIENLKLSRDVQDNELKTVLIFRLLPLLLPCPPMISSRQTETNNSFWKPSKNDVQDGLLLHVMNDDDLQRQLYQRNIKLLPHNLQNQPLIAIVGDKKVLNCYLYINNVQYSLTSPLQAVDIAFKSFYALQLQYPKEAHYPWLFIQHRIYGIKGESDIDVPCVHTLISDLRKFKNTT